MRSGRTLAQASIAATLVLQGKTYLYASANPANERRFHALVATLVAERRAAIDAATEPLDDHERTCQLNRGVPHCDCTFGRQFGPPVR